MRTYSTDKPKRLIGFYLRKNTMTFAIKNVLKYRTKYPALIALALITFFSYSTANACVSHALPCINDDALVGNNNYVEVYGEEFNASDINTNNDNLRREQLTTHKDHKSGVPDFYGDEWPGRRWSGFYNGFLDETAFVVNGELVQRGLIDKTQDNPLRAQPYLEPDGDGAGETVDFGNYRLFTSFFTSLAFESESNRAIEAPTHRWAPGHYFEIRVNFSNMNMGGHRHSFWLMPGVVEGGHFVPKDPYNASAADGVEVDIYEIEARPETNQNGLLMKVLAGDAGTTSNEVTNVPAGVEFIDQSNNRTIVNVTDAFAEGAVSDGWHKIGLYWHTDKLVWFVDGWPVVMDTQLVPQVPMYLILSREMNSGVHKTVQAGNQAIHVAEQLPAIPADSGLFGENIGLQRNLEKLAVKDNAGLDLDLEDKDHVLIDYVKVWRIDDAISVPPTVSAPINVRTKRYSNTSGELLWDHPTTNPQNIREYEVKRGDGEAFAGYVSSWYMTNLDADTRYPLEIVAVGHNDERSSTTCVSLGLNGEEALPQPCDQAAAFRLSSSATFTLPKARAVEANQCSADFTNQPFARVYDSVNAREFLSVLNVLKRVTDLREGGIDASVVSRFKKEGLRQDYSESLSLQCPEGGEYSSVLTEPRTPRAVKLRHDLNDCVVDGVMLSGSFESVREYEADNELRDINIEASFEKTTIAVVDGAYVQQDEMQRAIVDEQEITKLFSFKQLSLQEPDDSQNIDIQSYTAVVRSSTKTPRESVRNISFETVNSAEGGANFLNQEKSVLIVNANDAQNVEFLGDNVEFQLVDLESNSSVNFAGEQVLSCITPGYTLSYNSFSF